MTNLQQNVTNLQQNVTILQQNVTNLKQNVTNFKQIMTKLKKKSSKYQVAKIHFDRIFDFFLATFTLGHCKKILSSLYSN